MSHGKTDDTRIKKKIIMIISKSKHKDAASSSKVGAINKEEEEIKEGGRRSKCDLHPMLGSRGNI